MNTDSFPTDFEAKELLMTKTVGPSPAADFEVGKVSFPVFKIGSSLYFAAFNIISDNERRISCKSDGFPRLLERDESSISRSKLPAGPLADNFLEDSHILLK